MFDSKSENYSKKLDLLMDKYKRNHSGLHTYGPGDLHEAQITDELKEILSTMVEEDLNPGSALTVIKGLVETRPHMFSEFKHLIPKIKKNF